MDILKVIIFKDHDLFQIQNTINGCMCHCIHSQSQQLTREDHIKDAAATASAKAAATTEATSVAAAVASISATVLHVSHSQRHGDAARGEQNDTDGLHRESAGARKHRRKISFPRYISV